MSGTLCGRAYGLWTVAARTFTDPLHTAYFVLGVVLFFGSLAGMVTIYRNHKIGILIYGIFFFITTLAATAWEVREIVFVLNPSVQGRLINDCFSDPMNQHIGVTLEDCTYAIHTEVQIVVSRDVLMSLFLLYFIFIITTFVRDFLRDPSKYSDGTHNALFLVQNPYNHQQNLGVPHAQGAYPPTPRRDPLVQDRPTYQPRRPG
ncbi:hypothetical protein HK101_003799, partial [Irineochytrium annulatum]